MAYLDARRIDDLSFVSYSGLPEDDQELAHLYRIGIILVLRLATKHHILPFTDHPSVVLNSHNICPERDIVLTGQLCICNTRSALTKLTSSASGGGDPSASSSSSFTWLGSGDLLRLGAGLGMAEAGVG